MRHSLKPEYRKYVKGYGFLSFARNFGDKYGKSMISSKNVKILMDGAKKTSKDFAKIAGKKVIHKTTEATGDLVGNKIADKITSISKPRSKIILDPLIKMEFNKINNLLGPAHDKVPRFITKKWIEVQSQSGST